MTTEEISEPDRRAREDHTKMVEIFNGIIATQLRSLGIHVHDDAGNWFKPGSPEEKRVIDNIARNIAQWVVLQDECQTPVTTSCTCPQTWQHLPNCPDYPAYLKDA